MEGIYQIPIYVLGRVQTYICASGTSPDTPAPPYTCMAMSTTLQAILPAATLIIAI